MPTVFFGQDSKVQAIWWLQNAKQISTANTAASYVGWGDEKISKASERDRNWQMWDTQP